ncbi:hypothetical protein HYH03_005923 [Edaphochlamys debaryana]|uniref:Uncharacterized protein n=1 Tax=Edaphochlamys debaryana TaxID=47281 RepID=A0A836C0M7_9CHLO|nr:hypothetical protein HYH03_005923 [Edaphochlamys debaryana]|eukprot:KAG2496001.1 hypothetical protein HYH03_005923 [Edaphochlamys debaryana]
MPSALRVTVGSTTCSQRSCTRAVAHLNASGRRAAIIGTLAGILTVVSRASKAADVEEEAKAQAAREERQRQVAEERKRAAARAALSGDRQGRFIH